MSAMCCFMDRRDPPPGMMTPYETSCGGGGGWVNGWVWEWGGCGVRLLLDVRLHLKWQTLVAGVQHNHRINEPVKRTCNLHVVMTCC